MVGEDHTQGVYQETVGLAVQVFGQIVNIMAGMLFERGGYDDSSFTHIPTLDRCLNIIFPTSNEFEK